MEEPLQGMAEPLRLDGGVSENLKRGQSILGGMECIRTVLCINYSAFLPSQWLITCGKLCMVKPDYGEQL